MTHPVFEDGTEYQYDRLNSQTTGQPDGFNEWGRAWAVADRHGLTLYREGKRSTGKSQGKGYHRKDCPEATIYSATKYVCHSDGTWTYHTYDNMGESHHGTFQATATGGSQIGLGKISRYGDGTHNIVTVQATDKNYSKCGKRNVKEEETVNNSSLATTTYNAVRSFTACEQSTRDAIARHDDDRCGNIFGNLGAWIIGIIIIIIIIVIIVWAARGSRSHYYVQEGWSAPGQMGWSGQH